MGMKSARGARAAAAGDRGGRAPRLLRARVAGCGSVAPRRRPSAAQPPARPASPEVRHDHDDLAAAARHAGRRRAVPPSVRRRGADLRGDVGPLPRASSAALRGARPRGGRPRRRRRPELPPLPRAVPGRPRRGMVLVPLNQRHTDAELRYALEDSGAKVLFAGAARRRPRRLRRARRSTSATATRRCSPAPRRPTSPTHVARGRPRRALLHGRHDRRVEGRDAHPPQPRRQRVPLPGLPGRSRPDTCWLIVAPLFHAAGSIAVLATVWNARPPRRAARASTRRGARPDRARAASPPRSSCRRCSRRMTDEQLARPRDVSLAARCIGHGGSPIATETLRRAHAGVPGRRAAAHLRRDRDRADRHAAARHEERCSTARRRARAGSRRSASRSRSSAPDGGAACRPARSARSSSAAPNVMAGYWNKPERDGRRRSSTAGTAPATSATWTTRASSTSSTAPRT